MTAKPIRIGLIGGGMMSQVAHLPFYLADPRCEVLRVAESRPSLIAALGKQLGPDRIVADHGALLEDATIAALVISAPRPATGPLTLAALAAGKHVMTEKPMAHTVEQGQRLVDAATARGLIYAVGFMKRYDPGVQAAKTLIDETVRAGRLGRMLLARFYDYSNAYGMAPPAHVRPQESRTLRFATWPIFPDWLPERLRGAYAWFLNVAGHDVNLVRFFFPHDVDVLDAHCPSDGSVVATLQAGTVPIALEIAKTAAGRWLEGAEFLFERGRIAMTLPSPMAVERVAEVVIDDAERALTAEPVSTGTGWCFARQAEGFVDALAGRAQPLTTGKEGLADLVLTEQIWRKIAA
jgi:predicted dehydrogenase